MNMMVADLHTRKDRTIITTFLRNATPSYGYSHEILATDKSWTGGKWSSGNQKTTVRIFSIDENNEGIHATPIISQGDDVFPSGDFSFGPLVLCEQAGSVVDDEYGGRHCGCILSKWKPMICLWGLIRQRRRTCIVTLLKVFVQRSASGQ